MTSSIVPIPRNSLIKTLCRLQQDKKMLDDLINTSLEHFRVASKGRRVDDTARALEEMKAKLLADPPKPSEVVLYFDAISNGVPRPGSSLAFVAAWYNISGDYLKPLCEILEMESARDFHEAAVELLGEIGDSFAIPVLQKSVGYRWEYDQWLHVPRKALRALHQIGGGEAHAIITHALRSSDEAIRDEARLILGEG